MIITRSGTARLIPVPPPIVPAALAAVPVLVRLVNIGTIRPAAVLDIANLPVVLAVVMLPNQVVWQYRVALGTTLTALLRAVRYAATAHAKAMKRLLLVRRIAVAAGNPVRLASTGMFRPAAVLVTVNPRVAAAVLIQRKVNAQAIPIVIGRVHRIIVTIKVHRLPAITIMSAMLMRITLRVRLIAAAARHRQAEVLAQPNLFLYWVPAVTLWAMPGLIAG